MLRAGATDRATPDVWKWNLGGLGTRFLFSIVGGSFHGTSVLNAGFLVVVAGQGLEAIAVV